MTNKEAKELAQEVFNKHNAYMDKKGVLEFNPQGRDAIINAMLDFAKQVRVYDIEDAEKLQ